MSVGSWPLGYNPLGMEDGVEPSPVIAPSYCPKLAFGETVRVTRVDGCGLPVDGPGNGYVDDCWVKVEMRPVVQRPAPIEIRDVTGDTCTISRRPTRVRGHEIDASFWTASPELVSMLSGASLYRDQAGSAVGWDECTFQLPGRFALELWSTVDDVACQDVHPGAWWYWLLPHLADGVLGNITVADEGVSFTVQARTVTPNGWGFGPWNVQLGPDNVTPDPMLEAINPDCYRRTFLTAVAPPDVTCAPITVMAEAS